MNQSLVTLPLCCIFSTTYHIYEPVSSNLASVLHLLDRLPYHDAVFRDTFEIVPIYHEADARDRNEIVRSEDERSGVARRRSALRLLCELLLVGVHHNTLSLVATVRALAAVDFERDPAGAQASLSLLAGFAKWHRVEFLGFPRRPPADVPPDMPSEVLSQLCIVL